MDTSLHLHEFFVEGNNPEISHVLLNITEPSTSAEKDKGYFFAICEVNNANTKYIAKVQSIIDEIENSYYEIPDQPEQTAMEIVLDKVNQENLSLTQPEIDLHCIVGAIRENDIIFSFYGCPQMLLFYKTKEGIYKKMDLVEQNKPSEQNEQNQLFSQIIQGKIGPNDFFFAGTPHIEEYFNHDRLEKIITTRHPKESSEHLQRVLSDVKNELSFGGIIINLQPGVTPPIVLKSSPARKGGSASSLKNLFSNQRNTAQILSPSFLPRFEDKTPSSVKTDGVETDVMASSADENSFLDNTEITSSHLRTRIAKVANHNEGTTGQDITKKIILTIWKVLKYLVRCLLILLIFIGTALSTLGRNFILLFFVATNYQNRRHNILSEWARYWKNIAANIKHLPLITKILITLSLVILITFSGGITLISLKQKKDAQAATYKLAVQNINTKASAAESSLVYNDTTSALAKIQEAQQIMKKLSCVSATEKANCKDLQTRLDDLQTKARKVTVVNPQLLVDWSSLAKNTQISQIFLLRNKIYGFASASANIITYDPLVKGSSLITPNISIKNIVAASVPKENDYAALLYDSKNIAQFSPQDNSWRKVDIDFPNQNAVIANISVYNRKLYSLDTQNNQIYKHESIKTGFATGKEWLKNSSNDLSASTGLAVDGDVFVLGKNGTIYKFTAGVIAPFVIAGLDPQLSSANEIWTYNDLKYIYVLDAANKRIVVLDKTGQLKKQITAAEFSHPTSMIIDELKGVGYVLDNNKVYLITL